MSFQIKRFADDVPPEKQSFIPESMKDYGSFKIFGCDSPMIVVFGPSSQAALCFARTIDPKYCAVQRLDVASFDQNPPVTKDTAFYSCKIFCYGCSHISKHFSKETCEFDLDEEECDYLDECDGRCFNCELYDTSDCPDQN